ncbi:hypothetical protein [Marinoscillum sp. 108]|uniref:Secreted protein n=1 Tax=Marinoscillum luteum TaxID=861051 RepID=A0ABW7N5N6_9BACT|nr:hypothetical protein [Marinoscillum sp. 108]VXD13332.1 conserved exported hypothetical protein [Marinoscillum sp. 108]
MNNSRNFLALVLLAMGMTFGACSQDDTMDELIDNTEINSPSPTGNETDGEEEPPTTGG